MKADLAATYIPNDPSYERRREEIILLSLDDSTRRVVTMQAGNDTYRLRLSDLVEAVQRIQEVP